jgi:hypothetical protein
MRSYVTFPLRQRITSNQDRQDTEGSRDVGNAEIAAIEPWSQVGPAVAWSHGRATPNTDRRPVHAMGQRTKSLRDSPLKREESESREAVDPYAFAGRGSNAS